MNEQTIILMFLVIGLGATLWLYIMKAVKQVKYKGDERWDLVQSKANKIADIFNSILIILLLAVSVLADSQTTFTLQRVTILIVIFIGIRNLIELVGVIYYDKAL